MNVSKDLLSRQALSLLPWLKTSGAKQASQGFNRLEGLIDLGNLLKGSTVY